MTESPRPARAPGLSVRLKLTLSYAAFLMVAGGLLLAIVWVFLLRYVPEVIQFPAVEGSWRRGPGTIAVPNRSDLWTAFAPKAALMLVILLVVGLIGGWFLAGRMLAPLRRITDVAADIGTGTLTHRIRLTGRRDEFRDLADTFDTMLDRLQAQVDEQKRFAANASHELRTPLSITQTLLDVARTDPDADPVELVTRLRHVNDRAIDLTEALLALSRAEQRAFTREEVDLSLLAEDATETLVPVAESREVTIETIGEPALASGSASLLLQMVTNLVHNAVVHNLPAQGHVTISTRIEAGRAVLQVANTGAPMSATLTATLTEPFQRGNRRTRGDHGGVGLGLAIVTSIVSAHDGTIELKPNSGGGLMVSVRLPLAH